MQFLPLVVESTGCWGPTGAKTLYRIAKHVAARQGAETDDSLARCYESLSVIIRPAHGQDVLRRTQVVSEDVVAGPRDSAAVGALFEDSMGAMQLQ